MNLTGSPSVTMGTRIANGTATGADYSVATAVSPVVDFTAGQASKGVIITVKATRSPNRREGAPEPDRPSLP